MDRTERFYKIKELLRRRVRIIGLVHRSVHATSNAWPAVKQRLPPGRAGSGARQIAQGFWIALRQCDQCACCPGRLLAPLFPALQGAHRYTQ